ncbi:MAG TPA: phosphonoacetaldehyde hydrolase [Acidobacteriaceae bacterium]|nr:phosphonoacetaldehyde hydrolase [Acidobacteriaceae bacterium]
MTAPVRIRAIMLDWAGTTVDHGSVAPVIALQTLFAQYGIALSGEEARSGMGLLKRDHIRATLAVPRVRAQWTANTGREPGETEVQSLFAEFGPVQMKIVAQHSHLIPGVAAIVQEWQSRGIRIGSSTGYTRQMLEPVLEQAAREGYAPDASVCPDEVSAGRPAPWMMMKNAEILGVYPPRACVKIGDTVVDIEEGRNAGMWTIGLTRTGNLIGLEQSEWEQLPDSEKQSRLNGATTALRNAGADFVVEDLASCGEALAAIEDRLHRTPV